MVSAYAIPRYLLEIYKTDEENFEPYVPNTNNNEEESVKDKVKEEGNKETDEETYDVEENKDGFTLHQGEIQEIYYYRNLHSIGWIMIMKICLIVGHVKYLTSKQICLNVILELDCYLE